MIDFDRYVLGPCLDVYGRPVTYYPLEAAPVVVSAVFDDKYREDSLGPNGMIVSTRPMLGLRTASLPGGRLPERGERFLIDDKLYVVANPSEADGQGHVKVALRFASDEEADRALRK